jgi:lipopolysaccharide transport system permease protein
MTTFNGSSTALDHSGATCPKQYDRASFALVLESRPGWRAVDFKELYQHRDLLSFWTWRNLKARHAQSTLGIGWAVIQPVVNTVIFTVIFGTMMGVPSDGAPYPLFALCGMVVWTYFSNALREAVECLTRYTSMLSKLYFPRLILPLSTVLGKLLDLAVASSLLIPMMLWYHVSPKFEAIVVVPAMVLVLVLTTLGLGLWLSAMAIQYRDVAHAIVFTVQAMMYVSPIVYSHRVVPHRFRILYGLNPIAGVIGAFRSVLLGTGGLPWDLMLPGSAVAVVLAVSGLYYFRSRERLFADVA